MSWTGFTCLATTEFKKKNCYRAFICKFEIWNRANKSINIPCNLIQVIRLHLHHDFLNTSLFCALFYVFHFCLIADSLNANWFDLKFYWKENEKCVTNVILHLPTCKCHVSLDEDGKFSVENHMKWKCLCLDFMVSWLYFFFGSQ